MYKVILIENELLNAAGKRQFSSLEAAVKWAEKEIGTARNLVKADWAQIYHEGKVILELPVPEPMTERELNAQIKFSERMLRKANDNRKAMKKIIEEVKANGR